MLNPRGSDFRAYPDDNTPQVVKVAEISAVSRGAAIAIW